MTFAVAAESYDRFMGRYSVLLAPQLAALADVAAGQRVLDVGCGPGALTTELVRLVGAEGVTAVDPSESFVAAARERHPGVTVERAGAEELPFADGSFDAALAQLVVHFMAEPVAGLREMARVTRSGGVVAACVWDHARRNEPAERASGTPCASSTPTSTTSPTLPGARAGHLAELFTSAGLREVEETSLVVRTSSTRPSRTGGSRSRSASAPRARTSAGSTRSGRRSCGSAAARDSRSLRSC